MLASFLIIYLCLPFLGASSIVQRYSCSEGDKCVCSATMLRTCSGQDGSLEIINLPPNVEKVSPDFMLTDVEGNSLSYVKNLKLVNNSGLKNWGSFFAQYKSTLEDLTLFNNTALEARPMRKLLLQPTVLKTLNVGYFPFNLSDNFKVAFKKVGVRINNGDQLTSFEGETFEELRNALKNVRIEDIKNLSGADSSSSIIKFLNSARKGLSVAQNKTGNFLKAIPDTVNDITSKGKEIFGAADTSPGFGVPIFTYLFVQFIFHL